MAQRIPYYDELLLAMAQPGCAVCRVLAAASDRYIDALLFEMVNDVGAREALNAARGFCIRHAQLLVRTGGALGSAITMQGVLKVLIRTLEAGDLSQTGPSRLRNLARSLDSGATHPAARRLADELEPQGPCPACASEDLVAPIVTDTLTQHMLPGSRLASAFRDSAGLCLPHFRMTVRQGLPGPALTELLAGQLAIWRRLEAELEEFLRKSDHRFSHERMGVERDSWRRAIAAVSGNLPDHLTRD